MTMVFKHWGLGLGLLALASLSGCGGGGGGGSTSTTPPPVSSANLTGTAATGQPIAGVVVAVDVNGKSSPPASTNALGAFTVDVSGMQAPFILNIVGNAGGNQVVLNSVATAAGQTVNITPLTDLIVSTAAGQPAGSALAGACSPVTPACLSALATAATPANLSNAVNAVKAMVAPLNTAGTDPLTGAFVANGTGLDKVLDQILVSPATGQGATATVTLIAINKALGTVTLPATAGAASTVPAPTTPSAQELATAATASAVLPEIQACLSAFNALYAAPMTTPPTSSRLSDFVDPSFKFGGQTYDSILVNLSGSNAREGFSLVVAGLSPYDMSPFTAGELTTTGTSTINQNGRAAFLARTSAAINISSTPHTAWVNIRPDGSAGLEPMKLVRGAAYTGCPGGWKLAGNSHIDMHMNARVNRIDGVITREWAFHVASADVAAVSGATRVKVGGPGLSVYDSTAANGVGVATPLDLVPGLTTTMTIPDASLGGFYPAGTDAIRSCQDMKAANITVNSTTVPCMDESKAAPGNLYIWYLRAGTGATAVVNAFPFLTNAVPLSKAFAEANASNIFATLSNLTPSNLNALNALVGQDMRGKIAMNFATGTAYGAKMEHCGVLAFNNSNPILGGEQDAPKSGSTCTMSDPYAITTTSGTFGFKANATSAYMRVANTVLGNQAVNMVSLR